MFAIGTRGRSLVRRAVGSRLVVAIAVTLVVLLVGCESAENTAPNLAVHSVHVSPATPSVAIGDTVRLTGQAKSIDGQVLSGVELDWSVDDTTMASVTPLGATGLVRPRKIGTVNVRVRATAFGKSATSQVVIVYPAPAPVSLQPASALEQSQGVIVTVSGTGFVPESRILWNGQERAPTYVGPNTLRVALTPADLAQAGIVPVSVRNPTPGGGASAGLAFTVSSTPVARVTLDNVAAVLAVGQSLRINATPLDAFDRPLNGRTVTWRSGATNVATVDANGNVSAIAPGITTITAQSEMVAASAVISVMPAASAPVITSITPDSVGVPLNGQTLEVTITGDGFSPDVAVFVSSTGRFAQVMSSTTLKTTLLWDDLQQPRTHRIRVFDTVTRLWSNELTFVVYPDLEYLQITPGQSWLFEAETLSLDAVGKDAAGNSYHHPVTWTNLSPSVVSIDANGRITALQEGQAQIRATMKGRTALALINIIEPPPFDLLYEGYQSGRPELFLLTPGANATPRRVLPAGTYAADPAASPDGNRIAFVGKDAANNTDIYVANRDGTNVQRLTTAAGEDDQPTWSPDGTKLAFRSLRDGYRDIWVMNADGSGQRNLTGGAVRVGVPASGRPTWSPDGSRIAFMHGDFGIAPYRPNILTVDPNGQNGRLLIATGHGDADPAFSPNGHYIAFRTSTPTTSTVVRVRAADGTELAWLSESGHGYVPNWSPDSNWLTFLSSGDASQPSDVFITQLGSPMRKRVTNSAVDGGGINPTWIRR